jgi:hypothetical protein
MANPVLSQTRAPCGYFTHDFMPKRTSKAHGGARAKAGRPPKLDKDIYGQITCILRHDTIAQLREGADSRFFGEFLQQHLDRFPLPTREQYLLTRDGRKPFGRSSYPKLPKPQPWMDDPQLSYRERLGIALSGNPVEAYQKLSAKKQDGNNSRKARKGRALAH